MPSGGQRNAGQGVQRNGNTNFNQMQSGFGSRQGQPRTREHTTIQTSGALSLVPANSSANEANEVDIRTNGSYRIITANGIPNHKTGAFPNNRNPNSIKPQQYNFKIPAHPVKAGRITELEMNNFGIALNGAVFDPNAAEWYLGKRNSTWRYEALGCAIPLGVDENYAHVQPTGAYHYHGLPTLLMQQLGVTSSKHSPIIGWAGDGFPIYSIYGKHDQKMSSSYRLKRGNRPGIGDYFGGKYDASFVADYQYVAGSGDLDECNGKMVTTEDSNSSYGYFLTEEFPVIPRCLKGNVSSDFSRRRGR